MTVSADLAIETHGLRKEYKGVTALHGLDLRIPRHATRGFLGPNGAGKSTATKLLLGLARPTGGSGTIFGHDIGRESVPIRRRVGYLAQDPRYYEHLTARQTLRFVARFFYRGPAATVERRIDETLDLVGLSDRADRPIKGFSGGERQRLGIAHAQINQPELLIPDEPAAALDPLGRRDVLEVMARLRGHTTIFYSTHILDDVQRVSDSVVIMDRGRLVRQAPIAELLAEVEGVMYQITLKGDTSAAQERIGDQPWVSHLRAETVGGQTTLEIAVSDETAAEARLLGLLVDQQCTSESFSLWPGSSDSSDRRSDTMAQFFIHFRAHRPTFIVDMTDAERTTMAEHSAYMKRLLDEGVLILTGPCLDGFGGVAIVEVEGEAAARRVIANDPAVQAGIGTSELHPFRVALMRTGASNDCHALAGR